MKLFKSKSSATDARKLWESSTEFDPVWKKRITTMASHIDIPGTVADFGCGMMWLEPLLPKANTYLPVDYIQRDARTIVLDVNKDSIGSVKAEVAFLSGVLEYVQNVPAFVQQLEAGPFQKIILSYCTLEKHSDLTSRKSLNWVSHESLFSLLGIFLKKFDLVAIDDVNANTILVFSRKNR